MATRSFIGKSLPNNYIVGVYCHFDGYPEGGVGEMLETHYTDEGKIDALLALGDISQLRPRVVPEAGEHHTFESPAEDVTVAYHRDRGEDFSPNTRYESLEDMEKNVGSDLGAEWAYVWMVDRWETISL